MTVLAMDMIAPPYADHHLQDFFQGATETA
jgi:hypothetical protein